MVRSRANTLTKNKSLAAENLLLFCNSFPEANEESEDPYRNNKVRLNTRHFYKKVLISDLELLQENLKYKRSCGEPELLPYVEKAVEIIENQLIQMDDDQNEKGEEKQFFSIQKQKEEKHIIESLKQMIN